MRERVWLVEWFGVTAYISAVSRDKAKMRALRAAREAGYWQAGESLKGLRVVEASYVPPDVSVMYGDTK